jgi:hypothetical protein
MQRNQSNGLQMKYERQKSTEHLEEDMRKYLHKVDKGTI